MNSAKILKFNFKQFNRYLLFGLPLEDDKFYRTEKVYDVRYGNLFDEHMTYSFIGFDNDTAVSYN